MQFRKLIILAAGFVLFAGPLGSLLSAQDLKSVLARLDASAANFRSATAKVEYDNTMTDPIPNTDVLTGVVYYQRNGKGFESGVHFDETNGQKAPKILVFSGGVAKLYDKLTDQLTVFKEAGQYESYLALGFGASGKELTDKFHVKYLGSEKIGSVTTDKLELVAKDPRVLKLFPKITIWMDSSRGVSLKQVFDEGQGQSRTGIYSNIKLDQPLPSDAFTITTDKKTQVINR